jgi:hypothetical protein
MGGQAMRRAGSGGTNKRGLLWLQWLRETRISSSFETLYTRKGHGDEDRRQRPWHSRETKGQGSPKSPYHQDLS